MYVGGEFDLGKDGEFGEFVILLGTFYKSDATHSK